jgi:hypothetical protein
MIEKHGSKRRELTESELQKLIEIGFVILRITPDLEHRYYSRILLIASKCRWMYYVPSEKMIPKPVLKWNSTCHIPTSPMLASHGRFDYVLISLPNKHSGDRHHTQTCL